MTGDLSTPRPVTLVGGFLGAGKTTLLNRVLSAGQERRTAVLVNDFGQINIDSKLVVAVEGDVVDLANGCICCSIRGDLLNACLSLLLRPDPPEAFLVETSGVSDLGDVVRAFDLPQAQERFDLNAVIVVADCEALADDLNGDVGRLLRCQLEAADFVVLNKCDLADKERQDRARAAIGAAVPGLPIFATHHGILPDELAIPSHVPSRREPRARSSPAGTGRDGHGFVALYWSSDRPLSLPKLQCAIEALPEEVYRAKGFVFLEELPPYRVLLQKVGRRFNLRDEACWGDGEARTDIVAVARRGGFDDTRMRQAFEACLGRGDEQSSGVLRLARRIAPDLFEHSGSTRGTLPREARSDEVSTACPPETPE